MQDSTRKWQTIFFGIAVAVAIGVYLICLPNRNGVASQSVTQSAHFGAGNYNLMKTDTFVALLHQAYGASVTDSKAENKLTVQMKGSDLSRDFFNGNDALLKFGLTDFGFDIKYNEQDKSMKAVFSIQPQNGVNVPNDVIIKLMDKTTQVSHVNQ